MGLLPIPSPRFTQGASRAGIRRAAALYDKRLLPPSFTFAQRAPHCTVALGRGAPLKRVFRKPLDCDWIVDGVRTGLAA